MSDFAGYLLELRKEKDLSQQKLADALHLSLSTVKRAEVRKRILPNSKFLGELSAFTNRSKVDILEDILFRDLPERNDEHYKWGFNFLSYMYIAGWNSEPIKKYFIPELLHDDIYLALIAKKNKSMKAYVKMICNYINYFEKVDAESIRHFVFDHIICVAGCKDLLNVINYIFLFNNSNPKEVEIFNALKNVRFPGIRLNIKAVLYDSNGNNIVDLFQVTGLNFVMNG